jgi:uncharacterized protein (DUF2344 family)
MPCFRIFIELLQESEPVDIRLSERMPVYEAMARLNANMTDEMQAVEVYYPTSPLTDLKWLSYRIVMNTLGASEELAEKCDAALNCERLEIMKKTKSGEKEVDICTFIKSLEAKIEDGVLVIDAITAASQDSYLNPEYIASAIEREFALSGTDGYHTICRKKLLMGDGVTAFR